MANQGRGGKNLTQVVFDGERLDVMSVRRLRKRALSGGDDSTAIRAFRALA